MKITITRNTLDVAVNSGTTPLDDDGIQVRTSPVGRSSSPSRCVAPRQGDPEGSALAASQGGRDVKSWLFQGRARGRQCRVCQSRQIRKSVNEILTFVVQVEAMKGGFWMITLHLETPDSTAVAPSHLREVKWHFSSQTVCRSINQ
jgi:hypothetical protein